MLFFKKVFIFFAFFLFSQVQAEAPTVIVSVAPHQFLVDWVSGGSVNAMLMVPAGASSHTYEPTPKQIIAASKASIWFVIGEPFEARALRALKSYSSSLLAVDLRDGIDLISAEDGGSSCTCHQNTGMFDLHIWLSPRLAKQQAEKITAVLSQAFPDQAEKYAANLSTLTQKLEEIDLSIQRLLAPLQQRDIFVSHPAYAYFCRDYGLRQFSVEVEGKDPTPQKMTSLLQLMREQKVKTIFVQPQYNDKACRLIAEETGAKLVMLDPYSQNYLTSLQEITHAIAEK